MNLKAKIYTGDKTYVFPSGALGTKEKVLEDFPAALTIPFVMITDEREETLQAMYPLGMRAAQLGIPVDAPIDEVLQIIQDAENGLIPVEPGTPTPEERIAAAMEFQNLMML